MRLHLAKEVAPLAVRGAVVRHSATGQMAVQLGGLNVRESQRFEDVLLRLIPGE
jgi:hypothetical protein